ncbi:Ankyrin repeat protein [Mycena sanguinolenta]|uniref:Ankyrin repeat protein n=1 Tax=Mycena sanguinolenta TaxID=230812 RepID=A0A8H6XC05_9AGAR|nr:Ankyrin repeat protein [Mycena sanguinolenta]
MAPLADLPPELILCTVSFLTRKTIIDLERRLPGNSREPHLVPDLPSINSLAQINSIFHSTLNQTLYKLCASVETLGKLALLFAVEHELESTLDKLVAAGISLEGEFLFRDEDSWNGCSILHIAAANGLSHMVCKLSRMYGEVMVAKVHALEGLRMTALDHAALAGHIDVVRLLAPVPVPSSGTRAGVPLRYTHDQYLGLALIESARAGHLEISQYLVSKGADVNCFDAQHLHTTPLYYATLSDNLALVQLLLDSGADPNLGDYSGRVPLFNATSVAVAKALLDGGTNIHAKDIHSNDVFAYRIANIKLLRFLLESGVNPNHRSATGQASLHYACYIDDVEIAKASVELLLQFGAVVDIVDTRGRTSVDIAMRPGLEEVVRVLEPFVKNPDLKLKVATWLRERAGETIN